MERSPLHLAVLAAGLFTLGTVLAWLASPSGHDAVRAAEPAGPAAAPRGTGVLEVGVRGLHVPLGATTHAPVDAHLRELTQGMAPTSPAFGRHEAWSASAPLVDGRAAFGDVPMDGHFELRLTDGAGEELLRTTVLGPGHGLDSPLAAVQVRIGD